MSSTNALIEVRDLRRSFDQDAVQALRGVSFTVEQGEFVSVMGPSGSGKTTLLNILGALDTRFEGAVTIDSVELRHLPDPERFRSRTIGFVFQSFHLLPALTALENVQMPMFERRWRASERKTRAAALLKSVGLEHRLDHRPAKLSGGERQRVAIARSLANEPKLLLADEPTGNLDETTADEVVRLMHELVARTGCGLLMVTHSLRLAGLLDRTVHLTAGRLS